MKRISLSLLQHEFSEIIRTGKADSELLKSLGIRSQAPVTTDCRMGIYSTAYEIRMHEALEEDFPETKILLGEAEFAEFTKCYLEAYPSRSWTLAEVGDHLPEFAARSQWIAEFPFLANLALLEWSRVLADHAATVEQLDASALSNLGDRDLAEIVLTLAQTVQLLRCDWAVHDNRARQTTYLAVYRAFTGDVQELELTASQWTLLNQIRGGMSVKDTVAALPNASPDEVTRWFSDWSSKGIIIFRHPKGSDL